MENLYKLGLVQKPEDSIFHLKQYDDINEFNSFIYLFIYLLIYLYFGFYCREYFALWLLINFTIDKNLKRVITFY